MTFGEIIQNLATGGAVFLGITYIIGGLIVNLNLTRRGIVEYQVLKVKYLAVGMIFLFQFLGVVIFTFIPVVLIAAFFITSDTTRNALIPQFLSIPSILGALALLYAWLRYPPNTKSFVGKWVYWFLLSTLATLFPLYVLVHQLILPANSFTWVFNSVLAVLAGGLTIMAQIYHYSAFYYGRPAQLGAVDPIGMGIPMRVNLVCDEKISAELAELGLPMQKNIVRGIYLIDETSDHYIVSKEQVPGSDGNNETYKIEKGLVKVILHQPDHMRKVVEGSAERKKR